MATRPASSEDVPIASAEAAPECNRGAGLALARGTVLALALLLLCRDIQAPFNGWHQLNDAVFAQFARNHIVYGLRYTQLYCTWGDTLTPPAVPQRYLAHPPLVALGTAVPMLIFGDHEWAARLFPIAATLGSTALLMAIAGRLGSPLLGVLAGFFFVTLPLTAYFGRMICHEAPAQFFSLLAVHGYLHWSGGYGTSSRPRLGAALYAAAAALGVGTAWAVLVAAGLVWTWHLVRVVRGQGSPRLLPWLAAVPALATVAVVLHIAAGCGWDFSIFAALAGKRSMLGEGGQQPWAEWLGLQAQYLLRNFTWPGALAALVSIPLLVATWLHRSSGRVRAAFGGPLAAFMAVCGAHGVVWVVALKNQSWFHDYWQFFLAPYVALSLAGVVLATLDLLSPAAPRLARGAALALLLVPMPFAAASLDFYPQHVLVDPDYVRALSRLRQLVPERAPVFTSHRVRELVESLGRSTYRIEEPVVAYYADRPLHFSRNAEEVRANLPHCAAYVLKRGEQPWSKQMEAELSASFESVDAGEQHRIFLLDRPLSHAR